LLAKVKKEFADIMVQIDIFIDFTDILNFRSINPIKNDFKT